MSHISVIQLVLIGVFFNLYIFFYLFLFFIKQSKDKASVFFCISLYNYLFYLNTWFWVNWRDFKPSTTLKTQREHFLESSKRNGQKSKFGEICNYDILHHSSEIRSLCLMKLSSETLWNTKTHDCSFMFFTSLYLILQKKWTGSISIHQG